MQLRWTTEAAADLERIAGYLFEHVPGRAADLVRAVYYDAPASLLESPHWRRPGKTAGTRELVIAALPYLIVHTVRGATDTKLKPQAAIKILPSSVALTADGIRGQGST